MQQRPYDVYDDGYILGNTKQGVLINNRGMYIVKDGQKQLLDTIFENYTEDELRLADILSDIACLISAKRIEMNLSQKQFAEKIGVNQSTVSKWESGTCNFTLKSLCRIARILNLEIGFKK